MCPSVLLAACDHCCDWSSTLFHLVIHDKAPVHVFSIVPPYLEGENCCCACGGDVVSDDQWGGYSSQGYAVSPKTVEGQGRNGVGGDSSYSLPL